MARLGSADVAGIATLPPDGSAEPHWATYVRVDDVERKSAPRARGRRARHRSTARRPPPAGRLAIVATPEGATFGLWQPGNRPGAQRINEPNAWAMSTLRTPNLDAALPFYAAVFGWQAEPFETWAAPQGALLRLPGYVGGLPLQPVPRDVVAVAAADDSLPAERGRSISGPTTSMRRPRAPPRAAAACDASPFEAAPFRRAVIACPAGGVFTISQLFT